VGLLVYWLILTILPTGTAQITVLTGVTINYISLLAALSSAVVAHVLEDFYYGKF
jgi:hypothetical protein